MKNTVKLALAALVAATALSGATFAADSGKTAATPATPATPASPASSAKPAVAASMGANATGTATANVASSIAVTAGQNLNFGSFTPGTAAGTIQVNDAGVVTATGVTPIGSTATAGVFNVSGQAGSPYTVTLPTSVALSSGSNSMTASSLEFKAASGSTPTLSSGGTDVVNVGGTLAVAANQPSGAYTGTYNVSVAY